MAQLNSVISEYGTWRSLARERRYDVFNLRVLLDTYKENFKLLQGHIVAVQKKIEAAAFERDACESKLGLLQALLSPYRDACNHVSSRLNDEEVRLDAGRVAAVNRSEDYVGHFLRRLVLSTTDCMGRHIARLRGFC